MIETPLKRTWVDGLLKLNDSVPDGPLLLSEKVAAAVGRLPPPGGANRYAPEKTAVEPAPGSCEGSTSAVYASLWSSEVSNSRGPLTLPLEVSQVWSSAWPQNVTELILSER